MRKWRGFARGGVLEMELNEERKFITYSIELNTRSGSRCVTKYKFEDGRYVPDETFCTNAKAEMFFEGFFVGMARGMDVRIHKEDRKLLTKGKQNESNEMEEADEAKEPMAMGMADLPEASESDPVDEVFMR